MNLPQFTLPWPERALWPNVSKGAHWTRTHRARSQQKARASMEAMAAGLHLRKGTIPADALIGIHWTFCPTSRTSHFDDDNAEAAMKSARDQIAAVLGVDDRRFVATKERGDKCKDGGVIVNLRILDSDNLRPFRSIGDLAGGLLAAAVVKHKGAAE